jgi:hypothetical protein
MPRGGSRVGAGRKRGGKNILSASSTNRAIRERFYADAERGVLTPLGVMLEAMRSFWPHEPEKAAQYAAMCAPYIHPRLSTVNATAIVEHRDEGKDDDIRRLAMFMMAALRAAKERDEVMDLTTVDGERI